MSKKCDDSPDNFICERKSGKSRNSCRNSRSSSKKRGFRDNGTTFENCGSTLKSSNKDRRSRPIKDCRCTFDKSDAVCYAPILKKTRVDHSSEPPITVCHNDISEYKKSNKKNREVKRVQQNNKTQKKKKKGKKKRKKNNCKKKTVWRSLVCARFIQFLFKICCCSEYFDSSSTSRPCTDTCCCHCSCCKCCFCRPKSESKYVQCDDYEQSVRVASSQHESVDLRDSMNKASSCCGDDKSKKSRKCVTQAKCKSPCEKIKHDFLLVPCPGKSKDASSDRSNYGKNMKNAEKSMKSPEKGFFSLRCFKKRQSPVKSSVNEKSKFNDCSVVEPMMQASCCCRKKNVEPPPRKRCKFQETKECECDLRIASDEDNCDKTRKALLIMFDILFWPYACLPRRCDDENKTKEKIC